MLLRKIYSQEAYSNIAMNEALEDGKNCSPGFVRYVVKEILRRSMALDYVVAGLCRNGLPGHEKPGRRFFFAWEFFS